MIRRGEVWWASLPEPVGSEPGYRRPVVVVQADSFNRSPIQTVLAVGLSTNLRLAGAPGNFLLSSRASGLPRESVAVVSQLITVDRNFLGERVHRLDPRSMDKIEDGLRLILDL